MHDSTAHVSRSLRPSMLAAGLLACCAAEGRLAAQIVLEDATLSAGLHFQHDPDGPAIPGFQDWMVGGIAVADFDNDGWPDIFWASGGTSPDHLFMNRGDGTFVDDASSWGLAGLQATCGACAGDFDGDGWVDLYTTSFGHADDNEGQVGRNRLYRNTGARSFVDVASAAGVNVTSTTAPSGHGCAFGDYDLDGDLDLCATAWFAPAAGNRLFRNDGDGTFTDVTGSAIEFPPGTWGLQCRFADMDGDGWPELLVTGEFGSSCYFRNDGDGTFSNLTAESGTSVERHGAGQCIGDFDGDGDLDWFVSSAFDPQLGGDADNGNKLYLNDGDHAYVESAAEVGLLDGGWGGGAAAVDLDNDMLLDLVQVNGRPWPLQFAAQPERVFTNLGHGVFAEVASSAGFTATAVGRSLATLDQDRDGDLDLLVTFNGGAAKFYRNQSDGISSWLRIVLDTSSNALLAPNGFGTTVRAIVDGATIIRTMDGGPSLLNTSELAIGLGLGLYKSIDELRIEWPRGYVTRLFNVDCDQELVIKAPRRGDVNVDGKVDARDVGLLLSAWGSVTKATDLRFDQTGDGMVDATDLSTLISQWGT